MMTTTSVRSAAVTLALCGLARSAAADEPGDDVAHVAADVPTVSLTIEPLSFAYATTASVGAELRARPRVGVALLVGGGRSNKVAIGDRIHRYSVGMTDDTALDIRFTRLHVGGQATYYAEAFSGGHATGEVVYVRHGGASPPRDSIHAVSASVYGGWKWLFDYNLTVVLQAGIGIVITRGEEPMIAGLTFDREGTLGPIHLAANAAVGWSF